MAEYAFFGIKARPPAREQGKEEERFLSAQADAFVPAKRAGRKNRAGEKAEEKIGLLRSE